MSEGTAAFGLRLAQPADDGAIASIIRSVMPSFSACGPGFAINDPEVDAMSNAYRRPRAAYFVVEQAGRIGGGGGIAPLEGGPFQTCELRKMYFLPEVRGLGLGQELMDLCLSTARRFRFRRCYLETLKHMTQARALYERNGFEPLPGPLGQTGHFSCDAYYARALR